MTPHARRFRFPSPTALLVILSAIAGALTVTATVLAIVAYLRIGATVDQIQAERVHNIRSNCEDSNMRHDRTIGELDKRLAVAARKASPAQRRQILASRAFTVALITDLAPKHNCDKLVKRQVRSAQG